MNTNFKQSSAYELADALQETEPYYPTDYKLFDNAANMLRQQADRIVELEKFNKAILKKGGYPHKPLSDEEIEELQTQHTEKGHFADTLNVKEFARAIEERHGIK